MIGVAHSNNTNLTDIVIHEAASDAISDYAYISGVPLISFHTWDQAYGIYLSDGGVSSITYDQYTPTETGDHTWVGCVSTATAQMVYYWGNQQKINGQNITVKSINFDVTDQYTTSSLGINIDGDAQSRNFLNFTQLNTKLADIKYNFDPDEIAALSFGIGVKVHADYGLSGTSAYYSNSLSCMRDLGFGVAKYVYELDSDGLLVSSEINLKQELTENIQSGNPVLISMEDTDDGSGHAVIIDGYNSADDTFHFNMGWGGSCDGWYMLSDLPYDYDVIDGIVYDIYLSEQQVVAISVQDVVAGESADNGIFRITRNGDTTNALTVNFTTDGTATSGIDYTLKNGSTALTSSVVIAAGQSYVDVTLGVIDNLVPESTETAVINLTANAAYTLGATTSATINITDNDVALPTVTIAATNSSAAEPADNGTFRITRTGATTSALTIYFTASGTATSETDYTLKNGSTALTNSVVIAAGQSYVDVTLGVVDDNISEDAESVFMTLTANNAYGLGTITTTSAMVYIADKSTQAYTVTNANDSGTGSLREAIEAANSHSGSDIINFADGLDGSIVLSSGQINISDDLLIIGNDRIAISGNNNSSIFSIANDNKDLQVALNGVSLINSYGNAIYNTETLDLNHVIFKDNLGKSGYLEDGGNGGAILSSGTLSVANCQFQNNSAGNGGAWLLSLELGPYFSKGGNGGAVYLTSGNANFTDCVFDGNCAGIDGDNIYYGNTGIYCKGGAIYNADATLTISSDSVFANNTPDNIFGNYTIVNGTTDTVVPTDPAGLSVEFDENRDIIFKWTASTDNVAVDHYALTLTDVGTGSVISEWTAYSASSFRYTPKPGEFTWHVKAVDAAGNESAWSQNGSFTVDVNNFLPVPKDVVQSLDKNKVAFNWSDVNHATKYEIQVDTHSDFGNTLDLYNSPSISETSATLADGTYYYRVRASNEYGNSAWSEVKNFTVDGNFSKTVLYASDAAATSYFGQHAAVSGDIIATAGRYPFHSYIYRWDGTKWNETRFTPDTENGKIATVAASGNIVVIGEETHNDAFEYSGNAFVYRWDGSKWNEFKISSPPGSVDDRFAQSVAITGDTVVISADTYNNSTGAAFIYQWNGDSWSNGVKLVAADKTEGDDFGRSLAAYGDTLVIGAPGDDSGSAYI
ncbi:MAG: C10 family peptidase, partial [Victivallaceae bacterium]